MTDSTPILRTDGLRKYFVENESFLTSIIPPLEPDYVRAVDGVTLEIQPGETVALVGESGCGKSTLARAVLRLIEPTEGDVYFKGENVTEYDKTELREFRSEAQLIYQDPFASLNPRYTIERTLTEPMKVHGRGDSNGERAEIAGDLLERVGLNSTHLDRYPHEFSGGQRQRIGIARALAVEPEFIVADEPTSALDVSMQAQLLNLLQELQTDMDLSILYITHDLSVVRRIADRGCVMYLGKIVETEPIGTLFNEPKHPYTQALFSSIQIPDPDRQYERIPLEGDVPTPIDPPSGCNFHPRCPRVILPDSWEGSQRAWRRVLRLKHRLANDEIDPDAARSRLEAREGRVSDSDLVDFLYEQYVVDEFDGELPAGSKSLVLDALWAVVDGEQDAAVSTLDGAYTSVCETEEPTPITVDEECHVACHLYDDEYVDPSKLEPWSPRSVQHTD